MITIFINSKNSKTSDPHRLLLNLTDKIDLKRSYKYIKFQLALYMQKHKKVIQKQKMLNICSNME